MLMQPVDWYIHSRIAGVCVFAAGMSLMGLGVAQAVAPAGTAKATITQTRTDHALRVVTHTRLVTIHVRGRVIRRNGSVLVVLVPRVVFHNRTTHKRIVIPSHVVRIQEPEPNPVFPVTAAVIGVAPPPVTVYVPTTVTVTVPIEVPGPTVTSVSFITVTLPQATTTVTVPTTLYTTTDTGPQGSN